MGGFQCINTIMLGRKSISQFLNDIEKYFHLTWLPPPFASRHSRIRSGTRFTAALPFSSPLIGPLISRSTYVHVGVLGFHENALLSPRSMTTRGLDRGSGGALAERQEEEWRGAKERQGERMERGGGRGSKGSSEDQCIKQTVTLASAWRA